MARGSARARLVSYAITVSLAAAQLGASCVEGVTPDCSKTTECGPTILDGALDAPSIVVPEASTDAADVADASDDVEEAGDAADGG